ncbi:MAG: hypothetical protein HY565_00775 [Candidatus Kerfeldbacteria bacterium]|nr:hypothetical protein [Candidatus Kerfeldbacteria bacterium]
MKKIWLFASCIGLLLAAGTTVYAVGSGGGGSTRKDTNTNTNTEVAPTEPVNTNTVTNTNSNPTTETPTTTATTTTSVQCDQDVWECDDWSSSCDQYGNEERTCSLVTDCTTDTTTVQPDTFQPCSHLQCGDKPELRDRVSCRLNLTPLAMSRELEIEYLPEECRAITAAAAQATCIERYQSFQPCWEFTTSDERIECAKDVLGLSATLTDDINACASAECLANLQDRVYQLIKFRLYELEERAEELAEQGANLDTVTDFVVLVIEQKIAFNQATSFEQRRQAILAVRAGWQTFVTAVIPDLQ